MRTMHSHGPVSPAFPSPALGARVRSVLARRDRTLLADAVDHLLTTGVPAPVAGDARTREAQLRVARGVLADVEHVLRGDRPLDPRGVMRAERLLDDLRTGRVPLDDEHAVQDAARTARRLLVPLGGR